ncbi:MAG TPA: hypothetical protein VKQ52_02415, partial [Puia sp.]|nr:hypothetical protein [Puia sp.]
MNYRLTVLALLSPVFLLAQKKPVGPAPASPDSLFYAPLKYRLIGPFRGGRADAVSGSLTNKHTFYFGATG